MKGQDDIKSGTIQEILINVTLSIISQRSVSCYPEVEAIFVASESGLITPVALCTYETCGGHVT